MSSTQTLHCRRDRCRLPTELEIALLGLDPSAAANTTVFESNSHVMTHHYKYYVLSAPLTQIFHQVDDDDGTAELQVTVVSERTAKDNGDENGARPDGGFKRTYYCCQV